MWPFSPRSKPHEEMDQLLPVAETHDSQTPTELPIQQNPQDEVIAITGHAGQRLGIHPVLRAPILGLAAFICGFSLGAAHGGPIAAYRYRAENAHRLPTTRTGWFLYQKTKNYHTIVGGVKEGVKYGGVLTGWAALFMLAEEGIDRARGRLFAKEDEDYAPGQRDAANTVVAAMGVAGFYSWKNQLDHFATARNARLALKVALPFGLLQDLAASVRGSKPAYIEWLMKKFWKNQDNPS